MLYVFFQNRIEENRIKLSTVTQSTSNSSKIWQINTPNDTGSVSNFLTSRQDDVLCSVHSHQVPAAQDDGVSSEEESSDDTSNGMFGGKLTRPIQLPLVPKIPPYTTWTFLDRSVYNYMHFSTSQNPCCVQKVSLLRHHMASEGFLEAKYISWFHAGTRG